MDNKKKFYFKEYLKQRRMMFCVVGMIQLVYAIMFLLYGSYFESYLYGVELSSFILLLLCFYDFIKFHRKHTQLMEVKQVIQLVDLDKLPVEGPIEADYIHLIVELRELLIQTIEKTDQSKTDQLEYLTLWTHQIKTPVAAMRLILSNQESSNLKSQLEQEIFQVEEYINMVLQFLRINDMNSDLLLKQYDLYQIVKKTVKKYSILFIHKHLSLQFEPFVAKVITDEKWLGFVIGQILSNALKYTNQGHIGVYLHGESTLVIEDTGIGIRSEDIPRVFERGYTGYNGRLEQKSTGIGMYLCKTILDKLGHKIWIESTLGEGTRVFIDLKEYHLERE